MRPLVIDSFAGCPFSLQRGRCGLGLLVQVAQLSENSTEEATRILLVTDQVWIADVEGHEIGEHSVQGQAQPLLDSRGWGRPAFRSQHLVYLCEKILTPLSCGKFFGIVHLRPSALKFLLAGNLYLNSYMLKTIWRGISTLEIEI